MSITATFYTFSKRKNSTAVPSGGSSKNIYIKDPSSVLSPQILIETSNPTAYNYCYIPTFDRYYFISDWVSDHNMWQANCSVDVLASWRSTILNSYQYVTRSATHKNSNIIDSRYPMTKQVQVVTDKQSSPFDAVDPNLGDVPTYVMGLISNTDQAATKIQGIQYLQLTRGQARQILRMLLNQDYFNLGPAEALFGITPAVIKTIMNPSQYISESYILPFKRTGDTCAFPKAIVSSGDSSIGLGWWSVPVSGLGTVYSISGADNVSRNITRNVQFNIGAHPQSTSHGDYTNKSPFSQFTLFAGPFGEIPLDINLTGTVGLDIYCRIITDFKGNSTLWVKALNHSADFDDELNQILGKRKTNVAVDMPMIVGKTNAVGAVTSMTGIATGAALSGGASLPLSTGGVIDAAASLMPRFYSTGSASSDAFILEPWYLQSEYHLLAAENSAVNIIGSPFMDTIQLNELNGYTECDNVWLDIPCYESEYDEIINYLKTGFYIVKD